MRLLRNKNEKGFTLIELLVVIAIIGLLASVVLLALNSARAKSRDAKRLADVRQIASAMELYYNDISTYPPTLATLVPKYIGLIPAAPTPADGNSAQTCTTAQNTYTYSVSATGATYTLAFCLGDNTGGYQSGPKNLTPAGIQ
ncbi:MAG: type II secretion system protein [Candidatus Doudnabacteria bacterium]|nr:type II secretion system protein [Candidatus Doudnabacteria bacterium]